MMFVSDVVTVLGKSAHPPAPLRSIADAAFAAFAVTAEPY
jgi:hypothetical protein